MHAGFKLSESLLLELAYDPLVPTLELQLHQSNCTKATAPKQLHQATTPTTDQSAPRSAPRTPDDQRAVLLKPPFKEARMAPTQVPGL